MGKVTIFECDHCHNSFDSAKKVIIIDGVLRDGDEKIILEGDRNLLICPNCLFSKFEISNQEPEVIEKEESNIPIEYKLLKKISNEKEELEFCNFIGHITRESFEKVYNKSLINAYYPIDLEEGEEIDLGNFKKSRTVDVIYKVFASIPQVKKMPVVIHERDNKAIVDVNLLEE